MELIDYDFGVRDKRSIKCRLALLLSVLTTLFLLEFTLGHNAQDSFLGSLEQNKDLSWPMRRFQDPTASLPITKKEAGKLRILYLSNSHAFTGGKVSAHLQRLLDRTSPNRFEVIDMSDPGIFASDMLQRFIVSRNFEIDALMLNFAYISFSDRMGLGRQSFSARSFFNRDVFDSLSLAFFMRHYDLPLYLEQLWTRSFFLYNFRNSLRDSWERPLTKLLTVEACPYPIRFLEVDENRRWKFPGGFDNTLFDWSLYALGRQKHLADLEELLGHAKAVNLPVIAGNLPIDWRKEPHPTDELDISEYQASLNALMADPSYNFDYRNYQTSFPVRFTSYDALHPTWQGARLHALDLLLRLSRIYPQDISETSILTAFTSLREEDDLSFQTALSKEPQTKKRFNFRRFDISEPDNAIDLLARLLSYNPGTNEELKFLTQLASRVRFYRDYIFTTNPSWEQRFQFGFRDEVTWAKKEAETFASRLGQIQNQRLDKYKLPDFAKLIPTASKSVLLDGLELKSERGALDNGRTYELLSVISNSKPIGIRVLSSDGSIIYTRIDLLGDRSFIALFGSSRRWMLPEWVTHSSPRFDWGA